MSEQEAEALALRWVRIWMPDWADALPERGDNPFKPGEDFRGVFWDFEFKDWRSIYLLAKIDFDALLIIDQSNYGLYYEFSLVGQGNAQGKIACDMTGKCAEEISNRGCETAYREFRSKWMPFFRRGCWLSGCPIDASAHEKAEWIQDFSREEIEAWNLKI